MHHLEEQIALWKKQVARADSLSQSDLTELEQHLRDSITDLQKRGLSEEEAFLIGSTRLGAQDALAIEFSKVNGSYVWRKRVFWMLAGYLVVRLASAWIGALSSAATAITAYGDVNGTVMGAVAAGVTCAGWVCLLAALYCLAIQGGAGISRLLTRVSPDVIAIGAAGAIVAGVILTAGGRIMATRLVTPAVYGQAAVVTATASLALQVLVPIACLSMMWSLRRNWRLCDRTGD